MQCFPYAYCIGSVLFCAFAQRSAFPAMTQQHIIVTPTIPPVIQPITKISIIPPTFPIIFNGILCKSLNLIHFFIFL